MFISSGPDQKVRDGGGKIENLVKTTKAFTFYGGCKNIVADLSHSTVIMWLVIFYTPRKMAF